MLVISLAAILEEATARTKHMEGNIADLQRLLEPASLSELKGYAKAYCFLAFHGKGDSAVVEYLRSDTLPDDSGPDILVLFTLDEPAPIAVSITAMSFQPWAEISLGRHPSYQIVSALFKGMPVPPLPGLVVFEDLATDTQALYVPLAYLDTENEVRMRLRQIFAEVAYATREAKPGKMLDYLGVRLRKLGIDHERTGHKSISEWLLQAFQIAKKNIGDIVAVISVAGTLGAGR